MNWKQNPFESNGTSSYVEEAYPTLKLLDSDHEGDSDIEIQTLNVVYIKSKTLEL